MSSFDTSKVPSEVDLEGLRSYVNGAVSIMWTNDAPDEDIKLADTTLKTEESVAESWIKASALRQIHRAAKHLQKKRIGERASSLDKFLKKDVRLIPWVAPEREEEVLKDLRAKFRADSHSETFAGRVKSLFSMESTPGPA
jgi:hypothetical protein